MGLILLLAASLVVARTVLPLLYAIVRRSRVHGPVSVVTPGAGGSGLGWFLSLLWGAGEKRREEAYGYLRQTADSTPEYEENEGVDFEAPRLASAPLQQLAPPPAEAREFQPLTLDGQWWWNGRRWIDSRRFVPPAAVRSEDGEFWWDGLDWRRIPGETLPRGEWYPRLSRARAPRD